MFRKILFLIYLSFQVNFAHAEIHPLDNMFFKVKTSAGLQTAFPIEQRGIEYRKFLAASVKILALDSSGNSSSSGSGTIIYYDHTKKLAFVASCGHLWTKGTLPANHEKNIKCKIITWYHNQIKLEKPKSYDAKLIFYSYLQGQDTSLLTFSPDWEPDYFPIADSDYIYKSGNHVHSIGSDHSQETAHYDVELVGENGSDVVTKGNSPRPGRSGGGLIDEKGYYIGTCWGTEREDGSGMGFFTPLTAIHRFWSQQQDYEFLLHINKRKYVQELLVVDKNNREKKYKSEYILLPKFIK